MMSVFALKRINGHNKLLVNKASGTYSKFQEYDSDNINVANHLC